MLLMAAKKKPWEMYRGKLAAWYLFHELHRPFDDFEKFWKLLIATCRREKWLYKRIYKYKSCGGVRLILIPCPELMTVQKAINRYILSGMPKHDNAFGFSGGCIKDALMPIVQANQPIFCADVRNAFPQTSFDSVFETWRRNSFGFYASYFLSQLTTWNYIPKRESRRGRDRGRVWGWESALPQGAPTSPRLFDLCFEPLDIKLAKFATKIGGVYTRYADNIFLSIPEVWPGRKIYRRVEGETVKIDKDGFESGLPYKVKVVKVKKGTVSIEKADSGRPIWHSPAISAIFQIVTNKNEKFLTRKVPSYLLHKTFLANKGQILHALGLNLIDGQLHNKREFKHRLRLVLFNIQKALDAHDDFETKVWPLYQQANGMEQFAIKETLPAKLVQDCDDLLLRVSNIRYSGSSGTWVKNPQY